MTAPTILRIDASARINDSVTRQLADELIERLRAKYGGVHLIHRDLADGIALLDESWVGANFTDASERNQTQQAALALSDTLIGELQDADILVLAVPIYNFGVPAVMKAWADQVARARVTFRYGANGPIGLLADRPTYLVMASGGTQVGGELDFASGWLRHFLGFIGLHDVRLIAADRRMANAEESLSRARGQIDALIALRRAA